MGQSQILGSPEIWSQECVDLVKGIVDGVQEVTSGSRLSNSACVAISDTSELEDLLGNWSTDDTGTSWSWNKSNSDGTVLSGDLDWDGVWSRDLVSPISKELVTDLNGCLVSDFI